MMRRKSNDKTNKKSQEERKRQVDRQHTSLLSWLQAEYIFYLCDLFDMVLPVCVMKFKYEQREKKSICHLFARRR